MSCPTCKESILNQTESLIGQTQCNDPCPQDIACVDIIPSNCVFYSGPNLSCPSLNINYGDTITVALNKIFQTVCQSGGPTVAVTSVDTCPGYLFSKVTSSSLAITVTTPGGCEKLNIEEGCPDWKNVGTPGVGDGKFLPNWSNFTILPTSQVAQYSSPKGCSVKLRGLVSFNSSTTFAPGTVIFVLPVGFRPATFKRYSVNFNVTSPLNYPTILSGFIDISISGDVIFSYSNTTIPPFIKGVIISLDGIEFETN